MTGKVPNLSIVFMAASGVIGFAIPLVLLLYFRIKKKADLLPFFVGAGVMLVFALLLEQGVHGIVLSSPLGEAIRGQIWLYALYGGLMAGLFEETGRFLAFRTILKSRQDNDANALMYGAGHGGFEAAALLGITMINNIAWSITINSGNASVLTGSVPPEARAQVEATIDQLINTAPGTFLLGGVERIFAVTLQLAFSVLVWFAAKNKRCRYLYPAAILMHFLCDAVAVLAQGAGIPAIGVEVIIGLMAAAAALIAKVVWNRQRAEVSEG